MLNTSTSSIISSGSKNPIEKLVEKLKKIKTQKSIKDRLYMEKLRIEVFNLYNN